MQRAYIVVEGPHDVEFVARLLKPAGFDRIKMIEHLDPGWRSLVPTKFPHAGDLMMRVPVPLFLRNQTHSVALHSAVGIDKIVPMLEESWVVLARGAPPDSVGVLLDADEGELPAHRHDRLRRELARPHLSGLQWPPAPGVIGPGTPRCGTFVLPDNHSPGSLEALLVEACQTAYPGLHDSAAAFVEQAIADPARLGLIPNDLKRLHKPTGKLKATLASVASLLRPGASIAVAIQDCRWLDATAIRRLSRIAAVQTFLTELLGTSTAPPPN